MPNIAINGVDGSQFSSVTIASKSTAKDSDGSVHFDTVMDKLDKTTSSGSSLKTRMSALNDIFDKASHTYGVDVNLLKAIAKQESNFTSNVTSSAGAMGVMQLMPATAKSLGVIDPYDAEQNIMGGAKLIAAHLKKYNGNVSFALAAYSAGSGAVDKYGGIPPYAETQNYVKKVLNYYDNGVTAPDIANIADNSNTNVYLTPEQQAKAKQDAKLNKALADIPNVDLHLTSTDETDGITITPDDNADYVVRDNNNRILSSDNSEYSYEDYMKFANDYMKILSGSYSDNDTDSSSDDDLLNFASLSNPLTDALSSSGKSKVNASIFSVLQDALASYGKK